MSVMRDLMTVINLEDYKERKDREKLFTVTICKSSPTKIRFKFDNMLESVGLDRENFEKMVKNARAIMGWNI
jgi:hypothetical protein